MKDYHTSISYIAKILFISGQLLVLLTTVDSKHKCTHTHTLNPEFFITILNFDANS